MKNLSDFGSILSRFEELLKVEKDDRLNEKSIEGTRKPKEQCSFAEAIDSRFEKLSKAENEGLLNNEKTMEETKKRKKQISKAKAINDENHPLRKSQIKKSKCDMNVNQDPKIKNVVPGI